MGRLFYWVSNLVHHRSGYRCFCLTCKYYDNCKADTVRLERMEDAYGTGNNAYLQ